MLKFIISSLFVNSIVSMPYNNLNNTTTTATCNWIGHCLGDFCQNENDCDNNWVCTDGVCSVDADAITPVTVPVTPCNDCDDDCNDCTVTPTTVPCNTQTPV